jgi:DNA-binding response OmpR family regulator
MPHVLVIDDDETLCGLLEYKLKKEGYEVSLGLDGLEAMDLLKSRPVDVLVLDIMMPKMDGYHLLRELRENSGITPKATIVLSARGEEEDMLRAFELGAVDYVTKPFSINVLIARIGIALKHKVAAS